MRIHPAADLMPAIPEDEMNVLVEDIRTNGLLVPIEVLSGRIIDGRHRFDACKRAGVEPTYVDVDIGRQTPEEYVWSLNATRRHLTASQRAAIAVELLPAFEEEAKERMSDGAKGTEKIPDPGEAREKAASVTSVNPRYVSDAKRIKADDPELFEQVKSGEVSLSDAKRPHVTNNSGENEWYTPPQYIDSARAVMGSIDCDPASSKTAQKTVNAKRYFTIDNDGLGHHWKGSVWLNPPYSSDLCGKFASCLAAQLEGGHTTQAIWLSNNCTEVLWFQDLASLASAICFPQGRIKFHDRTGKPANTPLQGQAFLYFGDDRRAFVKEFKQYGQCFGRTK